MFLPCCVCKQQGRSAIVGSEDDLSEYYLEMPVVLVSVELEMLVVATARTEQWVESGETGHVFFSAEI